MNHNTTLDCGNVSASAPPAPAAPGPADRVLFAARREPSLPGGADEELRLQLCQYRGASFLRIVHFYRARDGWRPTKLGVTIRRGEVRAILAALASVADELSPLAGGAS